MRGYNYKFAINADKGTIKLKPTKGTYAKAFLPSLVIFGGLWALGTIVAMKEDKPDTDQGTPNYNLN